MNFVKPLKNLDSLNKLSRVLKNLLKDSEKLSQSWLSLDRETNPCYYLEILFWSSSIRFRELNKNYGETVEIREGLASSGPLKPAPPPLAKKYASERIFIIILISCQRLMSSLHQVGYQRL